MTAPSETEVKLARALLAWQRLGDRGFGPPDEWDCYDWRGWKLEMNGREEYFADEFEARAVKAACVAAHGLAEEIIRSHNAIRCPLCDGTDPSDGRDDACECDHERRRIMDHGVEL